jgi:hypothetical protein
MFVSVVRIRGDVPGHFRRKMIPMHTGVRPNDSFRRLSDWHVENPGGAWHELHRCRYCQYWLSLLAFPPAVTSLRSARIRNSVCLSLSGSPAYAHPARAEGNIMFFRTGLIFFPPPHAPTTLAE